MSVRTWRGWLPGRRMPTFALSTVCAACTAFAPFEVVTWESNYITYRHRYTDVAKAEVRKNAEKLCAQTKHVPVRTTEACSLTDCTTNFQCMDKAAAEGYR